jgi:hypothetical protein
MCLLKQGSRTLLYMTPEKGTVALVLGERSAALALESDLPSASRR